MWMDYSLQVADNSMVADKSFPSLPPELVRRIFHLARRTQSAVCIQRHWRGRDVRDWLEFPGAVTMNTAHQYHSPTCHLLRCNSCFNACINDWHVGKNHYDTDGAHWAWLYREMYLVYFNSHQPS